MSRATIIVLGVLAVLLILFPLWVNPYTVQVAITTITYSMLGLAFAFSMRVGLPRIDIAAWFSVGGYVTALLINSGMSFWLAALIASLIAVILGWLLFSLILPRGMVAFFVFCMLGLLVIPRVLPFLLPLLGLIPGFRGSMGILPPPTIGSFTFTTKPELYYLGLFFLVLTVVVYYLLFNSKIGRAWNAIVSELGLARSVGINVVRYRMGNLLIGNFFIALAGSYFVSYYHAAIPLTFSVQAGIIIMVYPFIGGLGHSLIGPVVGAIIATFAPEYFRVPAEYQSIVTSVMVILILIFLPLGILGWIDQKVKPWFNRWQWYVELSKWGAKKT